MFSKRRAAQITQHVRQETLEIVDDTEVYRQEISRREGHDAVVSTVMLDTSTTWPPPGTITVVTGRSDRPLFDSLSDSGGAGLLLTAIELENAAAQTQLSIRSLPERPRASAAVTLLTQLLRNGEEYFAPIPTDFGTTDYSIIVLPYDGNSDVEWSARHYLVSQAESMPMSTVLFVCPPRPNNLESRVNSVLPDDVAPQSIRWNEIAPRLCTPAAFAAGVGPALLVAAAGYAYYRYLHRNDNPKQRLETLPDFDQDHGTEGHFYDLDSQGDLAVLLNERSRIMGI